MSIKKMTPKNTDLTLTSFWGEAHYFWIFGGTHHLTTRYSGPISLQELSDNETGKLVNNLLVKHDFEVQRCNQAFRSLWNSGGFGIGIAKLPKTGQRVSHNGR